MAEMKGLFKDTAIYGISSMLGRFLSWGLTPFYTFYISQGEMGAMTNYYAGIAIILIVLTMGLETGFFRFAGNSKENPDKVFSTCLTTILLVSVIFLSIVHIYRGAIAGILNCADHPVYVTLIALVVVLDALAAIPFVYLRLNKKALFFAAIKIFSILLTIVLNIFFLLLCPKFENIGNCAFIQWLTIDDFKVGYIFLANFIASLVTLLLLLPTVFRIRYSFDFSLFRRLLKYSSPLVILGLAGVMNQHLDKLIYPYLLPDDAGAWDQLGIYAANAKIAVILVMFTQAFRYAFEPFIFSRDKGEDKRESYAAATKYFVISGLFIFLFVVFYIDIIKYLINPTYHEGLKVIPIVMFADLFNGVFFNLSLWYKLTDKTYWGAVFSVTGLVIIVIGNVIFVPLYGYMACAWSSFACYFFLMCISYLIGQKYYKVPYPLKKISIYTLLALLLYLMSEVFIPENLFLRLLYRTGLLVIFAAAVIRFDMPLSGLPIIGKYFRKK